MPSTASSTIQDLLSLVPGGSEMPTESAVLPLRDRCDSGKLCHSASCQSPARTKALRIEFVASAARLRLNINVWIPTQFRHPDRRPSCQNDGRASEGLASHVRHSRTCAVRRRAVCRTGPKRHAKLEVWPLRTPRHENRAMAFPSTDAPCYKGLL